MSREVKFRCWNAFSNHMHDWDEMVEKNKIHLLSNENGSYVCEQFTGLKDNDKVEVYESDVVEAFGGHTVGVIVMHNGSWMIKTNEDLESLFDAYDSCDLHVIGNIHQNPELLK